MKSIFEIINKREGQAAMAITILFLSLALIIGAGFASIGIRQIESTSLFIRSIKSRAATESGLEDVMLRLNRGLDVDSEETLSIGGGTVQTSFINVGTDKEVTSSGNINNIIRRAKVVMSSGAGLEYEFGVQVGEGGFCMDDDSAVIGNVLVTGSVLGPGAGGCDRSSESGDASIVGNVSVANGFSGDPDDEEDDYDQTLIFGKTSPVVDIAQRFRLDASAPVGRLWLFLRKVGSPGALQITVVRDSSGSPSNNPADIMAQTTVLASHVLRFYTFADVVFATSTVLQGNTDYWFILGTSLDANNYYEIGQDAGTATGQKYTSDASNPSAVWTELSGRHLNFKIWRGGLLHKIDDMQISGFSWAHSIENSYIKNDAVANTFSNSTATGTVRANSIATCTVEGDAHYNTRNNCIVFGSANTPITPPSTPTFQPLSLISPSQLEIWRTEAENGGTYSGSCPYRPADGAVIGPIFVPCDLEVLANRKVTLAGIVWVIGSVNLYDNSKIELHSSFGSFSGALVGEHPLGSDNHEHIDVWPGVVICGSEGYNSGTGHCNTSNGSYIHFIYINEPLLTSIHVENDVEGRAVFYDPHGRIKIHDGAQVRSLVVGYEFRMYPDSLLEFEEGLQSVGFVEGPPGAFLIKDWRPKE